MVAPGTWIRYIFSKLEYSVDVAHASHLRGLITNRRMLIDMIWKNFSHGRLTFLHWSKGEEMVPTIGTQGGTLLVRKLPVPGPTQVVLFSTYAFKPDFGLPLNDLVILTERRRLNVGDVVVLKDPEDSANYLVRRLAAIEGYEMGSTNPDDEPFVIEKDQCWVLADNSKLKPKEAYDSRTFGPVTMARIVGRAIYCLRNAVDHGPVKNSEMSTREDSPVLEVELDVDEMVKNHKA